MTSKRNTEPWSQKLEIDAIRKAQKNIKHFELLYNQHFECIFRFIIRKTNDEHLTADLTSKVFLNAMHAIHKYEIRGVPFGAWLYRIANNEINKHFIDQKKRFLYLERNTINNVITCDQVEEKECRIEAIKELIQELNELEIKIIELKYFENKNFKEISFILDKKESAVKMKLYRALSKIKEKFYKKSNQ
ncbi:MAG: sigma-70 family RNA polymerase sigma factor [Reichenbachiella sp.]